MGLVLAVVGLYALVAYSVNRRSRELGIRIALGATSREIVGLVLKYGVRIVLLGGLLGLAIFAGLSFVIRAFLFGLSPADPPTLLTVTLVFLGTALLASYVPARRAARSDPVTALRLD